MSLLALASAKGAPGVSTLAVALAALHGTVDGLEPLVAELDPHGGDLPLRYRSEDDRPLDPAIGLLSLAAAIRGGGMPQRPGPLVERHSQRLAGGLPVLVGVSGPDQAVGIEALWPQLVSTLAATGRPVFADVGRLGPARTVLPVLRAADAVILVARAELEHLAHLRERLHRLVTSIPNSRDADLGPGAARRVGVVLIGSERDRSVAAHTEQLLRSGGLPVHVLGTVADDPKGAALLGGAGRSGRTTLVRSVRTLLPEVQRLMQANAGAGLPTPTTEYARAPEYAASEYGAASASGRNGRSPAEGAERFAEEDADSSGGARGSADD